MSVEEILRRLRAILDALPSERPVSIKVLCQLSGCERTTVNRVLAEQRMTEKMHRKFERAFLWIENGQVTATRKHFKPYDITIGAPKPPQVIVRVVRFESGRPRIERLALNPNTFPDMGAKK